MNKKLTKYEYHELVENLKCCGNCLKYQTRSCLFYATYKTTGLYPMPDKVCGEYNSDGMIKEMRLL
jgi:hypothetical protein